VLPIGAQGQLQVEVDGALADLGGPRQRAVLLRLPVGQGSSVSVDRLLTDLYEGRAAAQRGERPARVRGGRLRALGRPEAVRLTEQRSRAQERRAELALTAQGGAAVVAELEALVREHPVREESWRLLALALYDAGQCDALAALRRGPGGAHRRAGPERRQRRIVCAVVSLARHMGAG
jgi:DNA-binding SARP family transcriptional activator